MEHEEGAGPSAPMIAVVVEPGSLVSGTTLLLPRSETHHLRVRRIMSDARLLLLDGRGGRAGGVWIGDGRVTVETVDQVTQPAALTLAVGAGDRDRFGWLVEKAAELGVTDVVPLDTDLTAGVATKVRPSNIERLQHRAFAGIKQSRAAWAPVVHLPHSLAELLARHPHGVHWLADVAGDPPSARGGVPDLVVVGPEGGMTPAERQLLVESGFIPVRLGDHVLRFETAAVAAAAVAFQLRETIQNV